MQRHSSDDIAPGRQQFQSILDETCVGRGKSGDGHPMAVSDNRHVRSWENIPSKGLSPNPGRSAPPAVIGMVSATWWSVVGVLELEKRVEFRKHGYVFS